MEQMARNAVDPESGHLRNQRYIPHDRDAKFCGNFRSILESEGAKCLTLPPRSPNLNAFAERWVRSAKEECLRKLILFGEGSLRRAMAEYVSHFHGERNHQGKGNVLLFPGANSTKRASHVIERTQRLGGLLRYCRRAA
jgi:transposase InsO family protein